MTKPSLKSTQHSKSHSSPAMSLFGEPFSPCTPEPEDSILKYQKYVSLSLVYLLCNASCDGWVLMEANDGRGAVRFVRFLLSPPPEEMETRSKRGISASQGILATRDDKR